MNTTHRRNYKLEHTYVIYKTGGNFEATKEAMTKARLGEMRKVKKKMHVFGALIRMVDRLCGLVVRVPVYRFRGPGSIPGATKFSEK
jgi:hypothetical protein